MNTVYLVHVNDCNGGDSWSYVDSIWDDKVDAELRALEINVSIVTLKYNIQHPHTHTSNINSAHLRGHAYIEEKDFNTLSSEEYEQYIKKGKFI
jgi:hypothetical protein